MGINRSNFLGGALDNADEGWSRWDMARTRLRHTHMRNYRVDEMVDDTVQKTHAIKATTPFEAAGKVLGQNVKLTKRQKGDWIRVVDEKKALVFSYIAKF